MANQAPTMKAGLDSWWLALIIAAGLALRLAAIAGFEHTPQSDELAYKSMALGLARGTDVVDNMGNHAMYNVGYPLFILAPLFYLFGENLFAARLANSALGAVSILLCYAVAKEAGAGRIGRIGAAAIWALYLPASVYGVYLAKENLMAPLMLGVVWCALRLVREFSVKAAVVCGILLGLLALTGNAALSLAGSVALALVLTPASVWQKVSLASLIGCVAIAVASPWMIRNALVIGAPVLNTNGGFNLYIGNNPAATGWFVSISDTPRGPTWGELRNAGEVEASETLKTEALSWITAHPGEFLALAIKKIVYFWSPPFHEGRGRASSAESAVRVLWAIQFVTLVVGAVAGLAFARLRNRRTTVLWLSILCYTGVHALFYVIFRYREPIMPFVGLIAALAVEALLMKGWLKHPAAA